MARSDVIYVVLETTHGLPIAGFTVKHELKTWTEQRDTSNMKFFRVKDGLRSDLKVEEIFYPFELKRS